MAEITAALVKELRERTGAGMMDCKKALAENHGDIEASIDWLRTKGLAAAAKKARSEEHTSELQSLMRISYAVFCLKKKKHKLGRNADEQYTMRSTSRVTQEHSKKQHTMDQLRT